LQAPALGHNSEGTECGTNQQCKRGGYRKRCPTNNKDEQIWQPCRIGYEEFGFSLEPPACGVQLLNWTFEG
jgi:hypothetical protein